MEFSYVIKNQALNAGILSISPKLIFTHPVGFVSCGKNEYSE